MKFTQGTEHRFISWPKDLKVSYVDQWVDKASTTETVDSVSISGSVKPKI